MNDAVSKRSDDGSHDDGRDATSPMPSKIYLLVSSLPPPPTPMRIADQFEIRPLPIVPSFHDLAALGASGLQGWESLCRVVQSATAEIAVFAAKDERGSTDILYRGWLLVGMFMLRGWAAARPLAACTMPWSEIAGHGQRSLKMQGTRPWVLPGIEGRVFETNISMFVGETPRVDAIGEQDRDWVEHYFEKCDVLAMRESRFANGLFSVIDFRKADRPEVALTRLWMGIEAQTALDSELMFKLSVYLSALLEERGENRIERQKAIKKLYVLRSKVVHGKTVDKQLIGDAMAGAYDLLRSLLLIEAESQAMLDEKALLRRLLG